MSSRREDSLPIAETGKVTTNPFSSRREPLPMACCSGSNGRGRMKNAIRANRNLNRIFTKESRGVNSVLQSSRKLMAGEQSSYERYNV